MYLSQWGEVNVFKPADLQELEAFAVTALFSFPWSQVIISFSSLN